MNRFKRLLSRLPVRHQQDIRRLYYARQMTRGTFVTDEPEFRKLDTWLHEGDCVLDIGANIGHYTCRLAHLVGPAGHVIAFEPVPETFDLLSSNVARLPTRNVTLLNAAASDRADLVGMTIPMLPTGLRNYYMAQVTEHAGDFRVRCLPIDALDIASPVRLAKIDAEGHELSVLRGMRRLILSSRPTLIVEGKAPEVMGFLAEIGYTATQYKGSPNVVYFWRGLAGVDEVSIGAQH